MFKVISKQASWVLFAALVACGTEPMYPYFPTPSDAGGDTTTGDVPELDGSTDDVAGDGPTDDGPDVSLDAEDAPTTDVSTTDVVGTETSCTDEFDNDDNGLTDCDDPACSDDPACVAPPPVCGELIVGCAVIESGADPSSDLIVSPLETIECFADVTTGAGEFNWMVIEAPHGSTSLPTPDNDSSTSFFVALAGQFVLGVSAAEDNGCEHEATVTVVSRAEGGLYYQLVWHTPEDVDETDVGFGAGSDVDIHLVHENGCWEDSTWDCHFRAREPNWGNPARSEDDPRLDIDDTDGAGPEAIALGELESGVRYLLGAHYYNDHGYGVSLMTAQIYLEGELVYEARDVELSDGQWWFVASLESPSWEITPVGDVYPDVPPCRE